MISSSVLSSFVQSSYNWENIPFKNIAPSSKYLQRNACMKIFVERGTGYLQQSTMVDLVLAEVNPRRYPYPSPTELSCGSLSILHLEFFRKKPDIFSGGSRISRWGGCRPVGGAPTSDAYTFW